MDNFEYVKHLRFLENMNRLDKKLGFTPFKRDRNGMLVVDFDRTEDPSCKTSFWRKIFQGVKYCFTRNT